MLSLCSFLTPLLLLLGILLNILNVYNDIRRDNKVAVDAEKTMCSSGWCGRHDIRYPFMLNSSTPSQCGDHRYTLSCENNNQLFLYHNSMKLKVQSINYNNYTIRLVDSNVALHSLLPYSLTSSNFTRAHDELYQDRFYYTKHHSVDVIRFSKQMLYLMRCPPYGVESSPAATCINGSYALGSTFYVSDPDKTLQDLAFGDSCQIEWMYLTSWPAEIKHINISCTDIHHMLLYGFQLSWLKGYCNNETLFAMLGDDHNNIICFNRYYQISRLAKFLQDVWLLKPGTILFVVAKFVLGAPCIVIFCICKWRRRHLSIYDSIEDFLRSDDNIMPIRYSYKEIKNITGKFNTKLGNGGYGSVFRGKLRSGRLAAVKVLNEAKSNGEEFMNEVATIGRIHHVNVVQLIGFCVEGSKRALIYELMENGSLEKYIFSSQESALNSLSCDKLYTISLGVARGIEYLHNGCDIKILHFDIKPHNILLDENFNPKVSDFGLARLCPTDKSIVSLTAARGTIGYMAPELFYRNVGAISYKADVYSFGMLLMEMASRRKNLNALTENSSQIYFPFWVYDELHDGREITIENDTDEETKLAKKMMIVALWCIQTKPNDRPSMKKVVEMLEQDEDLLEMPPKPYFYPLDEPADKVGEDNISRLSSDMSSVTSSK